MAGQVRVDGQIVRKAGHAVKPDQQLECVAPAHPWVSRGGLKLDAALEAFGLTLAGRVAADIGASTGGFTHRLLDAGVLRVYAVDVGRGLLDARLRDDPRVQLREGVNARHADRTVLPEPIDVLSIDVAFISALKLLPALCPLLAPSADVLLLVKPQFELERARVGRGVVRDPRLQAEAVVRVAEGCRAHGLEPHGLVACPIKGARGNREFVLWLRADPGWDPPQLAARATSCAMAAANAATPYTPTA